MKLRKQMGYKKQGGCSSNQFIIDSKYIMPRVYNTEKKWAEKLGMADKFISWEAYRNKMSADFSAWETELRKFTMWLMSSQFVGAEFELTEDSIDSDGSIKEIGVHIPNVNNESELEETINKIWSVATNTSLTDLYRLYTDKNSPIKVA